MKRPIIYVLIIAVIVACSKENGNDMLPDRWNGYQDHFKSGEVVHTLWAGQNIDVGTVTYGIDSNACFYVKYDCTPSGWMISETHMFAGDKEEMPVNKPGSPKIGRFPYSSDHDPMVSTYTYTVPLTDLPPAEDPGFVVASHCVVHSPSGQNETAWAEGDYTFSDKGWGWYDTYYFDSSQDTTVIIYGTQYSSDTLKICMIDVTHNTAEWIIVEQIEGVQGRFDAAAYNETSDLFYFADYYSGELWINPLGSDAGSFFSGYLTGTPASGCYYGQSYYYVDEQLNSINKVDFSSDWTITQITVLSIIPGNIIVSDITVTSLGTIFYIVGELDSGGTELLTWDMATDTYSSLSMALNEDTQIAYGSDGNLYALGGFTEGSGVETYFIDTSVTTLTPIYSGVIAVEEPISDVSRGPSL